MRFLRNAIMLFVFSVLTGSNGWAQVSNWKHYDLKDGMPASTAYCITQDKQGFIWMGTEAGLVKFDGHEFKTYTVADGLPDNEIIGITADSLNRIWITPFRKNTCYYKEGKIYTEKNDSLLAQISRNVSLGYTYYTGKQNRVWLYSNSLLKITYQDIKILPLQPNTRNAYWVEDLGENEYVIYTPSQFTHYKNNLVIDSFNYKLPLPLGGYKINLQENRVYCSSTNNVDVYERTPDFKYHLLRHYALKGTSFGYCVEIDNKIYIPSIGYGTYIIDRASKDASDALFIPNHANSIFKDRENNIWVATADNGIFFLHNNSKMMTIDHNNGLEYDNTGAVYVDSASTIWIGDGVGALRNYSNGKVSTIIDLDKDYPRYSKSREILAGEHIIGFVSDNYPLMIYDTRLKKSAQCVTLSSKSLTYSSVRKQFVTGLSTGIAVTDIIPPFHTKYYIEHKRITAICEDKTGQIFCGTTEGLYQWKDGEFHPLFINNELLAERVTALTVDNDNILWIGSSSNNLLALKDSKVITQVNPVVQPVYTGSLCRSLFADNHHNIWVATNNGLDRISYTYSDGVGIKILNTTPYFASDGLADNDINDVYVRDSVAYIATAKGVSVFNYFQLSTHPSPPVFITAISINQRDTALLGQYALNYDQNDVLLKFTGISFISEGHIRYRYKLFGADDDWSYTQMGQMEFKSLRGGTYTFVVQALDKFGIASSKPAQVIFIISTAYYNTLLFKLSMGLLLAALIYASIYRLFYIRRKKAVEKYRNRQKINLLEQKALRAQMNPHFIFNSLTAIQHFIQQEDFLNANKYLTSFSRLMRKTLDNSGEAKISIEKEMEYLENYILMEQMRFKGKFIFSIKCDESIDKVNTLIPTMLLQPFVENAIRHGLRNKEDNTGFLDVHFFKQAEKIVCKIEDNGIGLLAAQQMKSTTHIEYQSKGLSISNERIEAMNHLQTQKIQVMMHDKKLLIPPSEGTIVEIILA